MRHPRLIILSAALLLALILVLSWDDPTDSALPMRQPRSEGESDAKEGVGLTGARRLVPAAPTTADGVSPEQGALWGTVFDEEGKPLEGAEVYFVRMSVPGSPLTAAAEKQGRHATSDVHGAYRTGLEPGLYAVRARFGTRASQRHEVHAPSTVPLDLRLVKAESSLVVRLVAAHPDLDPHAQQVRVGTSEGQVGARNRRNEIPITGLRIGDIVRLHVTLGTSDRSIAFLPSQGPWREYLIGDRSMQAVVKIEEAATHHTFRLARLARIKGRIVVGESGAPRANYTVLCRQGSSWKPRVVLDLEAGELTFSTWVLPGRETSLFVMPARAGDQVLGTERPIHVERLRFGEEADVNLRVSGLRNGIQGIVVDVDGTPLPRAIVKVIQYVPSGLDDSTPSDFVHVAESWTDSGGAFSIAGLLPASSVLDVVPSEHAIGVAPLPIPVGRAGWTNDFVSVETIQLQQGGSIKGTLRVPKGRPKSSAKEVSIRIIPVGNDGQPLNGRFRTVRVDNHDGATFTATGLAPGTYRLLAPGPFADVWSAPLKELRIEAGKNTAMEILVR